MYAECFIILGNEAVLFLRLHLLQGIVLFHQNKREEALHLLMKVKTKIQELKVDDDSILSLTELGKDSYR